MRDPIRVLHVDDGPDSPDLTAATADDDSEPFDVRTESTAQAALERLETGTAATDCIVSEYRLAGLDGLEFLARVRERDPELPFVLYTEAGSEAVASDAISLGVTDYLRKSADEADERLADRVTAAVERYRRVRRLRADSDLLDKIFDHVPVHLFVKDTEGRHVRVSKHLTERVTHETDALLVDSFSREEILGKTDVEIATTDHERQAHADDRRVIETGEPIINKEEYSPLSTEWNVTSKVPWYNDDGSVRGLIGITHRITERKRYEQELERQNERLGEFTSIVSHDLRNPLNVARGHLEAARLSRDSDHLATVAESHERMESLIENLLTVAREGKAVTEFDTVPLTELVETCWQTVETGAAELVVETDAVIRADRSRAKQLLENLFRNSVEHGSTSSQSENHADDSVEHGSTGSQRETRADDSVAHSEPNVTVTVGGIDGGPDFYVADDGPGIPPDERDRVLERGYSTAADGTGFGLSIVTQIADAHGWRVSATEAANGGARFDITGVDDAASGR
ncbi:hybrid sensor histidine kinase/response regulator [Natrinema salaciae]|uniref:histidine kinase n=1 Tax=Natrinema salaciae TaxID=1186196 RepID=A0A1H9IC04_9EURY|nr:ATP-binding protein [Natrinema salaciae]SEQ71925.1 His Kinase A (phospho-acceptor) domain-containing protein [Natrinema salaciae]